MAVDTMRVRLHLRLIRVLTVLVDTVDRLEVEVASTRSWSLRLGRGRVVRYAGSSAARCMTGAVARSGTCP